MSYPDNRLVTYEELKQHSDYSSAWISIDGTVYDITRFISKHPFGDTFRGNLGTECGGLFSSAHLNTNAKSLLTNDQFAKNNGIVTVGRLDVSRDHLYRGNEGPYLDRIVYQDTQSDEFWLELRSEVRAYLRVTGERVHHTVREGALYVSYYFAIYFALAYLAWIQGSLIAATLLGVHMLCAVANVSHMATHHGFTRSPWLNFIAEQLFDLGGMSWLEWQIAHQTHHNQPHSSIDYQTNEYDSLGVRIHKYVMHERRHRYQHIYFWIVVAPYLLYRLFMTSAWLFWNREFVRHRYEVAAHVLARVILVSQVAYAAYLHGIWRAAALFALYSIAYSYSAFVLLYNDHEDTHGVLGQDEDVGKFHNQISWAQTQVRTSNNWYPTNWLLSFIEFHYGYFNYHIEHHLFPTFKPSLCKKISPIVREVCERHDVPYISTTFVEVQRSLQHHITELSASK